MDPAPPQPTRKCNKCKPEVVSGPPRYARAAYAVTFMGMHEAVIPFQREQPTQGKDAPVNKGSYGGGFEPPIIEQLAFVRVGEAKPGKVTAQIAQSQPRAIVWDGARDALYVAGLGTDSVQQLRDASTVKISAGTSIQLDTANDKCGPDGLAIDDRGDLLVWCAFSRRVVVVPTAADGKLVAAEVALAPAFGPAVAPTTLTPDQHAGMILFHSAQPAISQRGSLACASCHPDGRADGMTWQIEDHLLQTPILAGRVDGTAPYKWDGTDKDLATSITSTMNRLGGQGLQPDQIAQLAAYVTQLAEPRAPVREAAAVARGKQVFQSSCSSCHDGASYTDRSKHSLQGTLATVDTPSLRGLYASAPYYHDGSAPTLDALLHEQGAVHGMADLSQLTDAQRADLRTYLETL
jgi:mono/diheme cytochrome c family protein